MAIGFNNGLVYTGTRARLVVNGVAIAYCSGCRGREDITYEPIKVLDHIQTVEFSPVDYNVQFSAQRFRLIGGAAGVEGSMRGTRALWPKLGKNDNEFLENIINQGEVDAQLEDRISQEVYKLLMGTRMAGFGFDMTRGPVMEDVDFVGVEFRDETELE